MVVRTRHCLCACRVKVESYGDILVGSDVDAQSLSIAPIWIESILQIEARGCPCDVMMSGETNKLRVLEGKGRQTYTMQSSSHCHISEKGCRRSSDGDLRAARLENGIDAGRSLRGLGKILYRGV